MASTAPGDRHGTPPRLPGSTLTQEMFDNLLTSLHRGSRETAGEIYEQLRDSLIHYFERRRCSVPDTLADQALDRVAIKLMKNPIPLLSRNPGTYFLRVARFIYLEYVKKETTKAVRSTALFPVHSFDSDDQGQYECLQACLMELSDEDRRFFREYEMANARGKRNLAESQGISINAVTLRAFKIRRRLEACTRDCFELTRQRGK
jgi:DNA-directed RNA polymerase specialized sigma24 family protein